MKVGGGVGGYVRFLFTVFEVGKFAKIGGDLGFDRFVLGCLGILGSLRSRTADFQYMGVIASKCSSILTVDFKCTLKIIQWHESKYLKSFYMLIFIFSQRANPRCKVIGVHQKTEALKPNAEQAHRSSDHDKRIL